MMKESAKYCRIARGSLVELEIQLTIANEINYIESSQLEELLQATESLHKQINALLSTLTK